jgi:hypothetical protein
MNADTMIRIPLVIKGNCDPDKTAQKILALSSQASSGMTTPDIPSVVRFQGFTPYGISVELWIFAKAEVLPAMLQDAVVRSLVGQDFLMQDLPADVSGSS